MPSARELVESLAATVDIVIDQVVPRQTPCALIDYPNYRNVGDHGIWLGELRLLARTGRKIVYSCTVDTYDRDVMGRRIGGLPILLSGGGNVGDLYPAHQALRERILRDFPHNKVVQLPQSIHFAETATLARAKAVFNDHSDFTLLVREHNSLRIAKEELAVAATVLCPDMVFALGPLRRPDAPCHDILVQSRADEERRGEASAPSELVVHGQGVMADWKPLYRGIGLPLRRRLADAISADSARRQTARDELGGTWWTSAGTATVRATERGERFSLPMGPFGIALANISRAQLRRGCKLLCRGQVVVTDRLHGHALSLMMGIPHVVCDNSYGKVGSFVETWTSSCELAVWSDSITDGYDVARGLVEIVHPVRLSEREATTD